MTEETAEQRPSGPLGTWIAVVGAIATAALGLSIVSLVMGLQKPDDAGQAAGPGTGGGDVGAVVDDGTGADAAGTDPAGTGGQGEDPAGQGAGNEQPVPAGDPRDVPGVAIGEGGVALAAVPAEPSVRIDTYFDFMCPYCSEFEKAFGEGLQGMVDSGQIVLVQHPIAILDRFSLGTNYSSRTAAAAYVVAAQAPETFSAFVAALFDAQPEENSEGLTDEQILGIATEAGVPEEVSATFWEGDYVTSMMEITMSATNAGITGTPTVMISTPDSVPEKWDYQTPLDQLVAAKSGE
jgi:protein-disulfide isomerase